MGGEALYQAKSHVHRWPALHPALHSAQKGRPRRPLEMTEELPFVRAPRPRRGFRLTSRDRAIVRWIGRLRMAGAAQVAERFGLGRAVSYARLGGLVRAGTTGARADLSRCARRVPRNQGRARVGGSRAPSGSDRPSHLRARPRAQLAGARARARVRARSGENRARDARRGYITGAARRSEPDIRGADERCARPAPAHPRPLPPPALSRLRRHRRAGRERAIARGRARAHSQGASATAPYPRRLRRGQTHRLGPLLRLRQPRPQRS
jgi:hypothetical protein